MGISNMLKKTKIICTQGPATEKPGVVDALIENVREYAKEHGLETVEAIEAGMAEKSEEFEAAGGRVYLPLSAE